MTWKRRDPFQTQLDLGLEVERERSKPEVEPERPKREGGRQASSGGSWLRRYSVLEPVPGRVLWPDGRAVRDDERRRILLGPQAHGFLALEQAAWDACEDRVWPVSIRRRAADEQDQPR